MTSATGSGDEPLYGATPPQAVARFFRRYVVFTGRASRSEFWWTYLFVVLSTFVLGAIGLVLGLVTATAADLAADRIGAGVFFAPVSILLFGLAVVVPGVALVVRRIRDTGLHPLLALLWLIPYVGGIVVLILCILPTQQRVPQGRAPQGVPAPGGPGAAAADLAHAIGSLAGGDREQVAQLAQRWRATVIAEDDGIDRLALPEADVVVRYGAAGGIDAVGVERA